MRTNPPNVVSPVSQPLSLNLVSASLDGMCAVLMTGICITQVAGDFICSIAHRVLPPG